MGLNSWLTKRRVAKAVKTLKAYAGKDQAELAREGGWDLVAGNDWSWMKANWQGSDQIWKNYSTSDLEITYAIASTIHACVKLKATTANQVWYEVGRYTERGWKEVPGHPFHQLMRRPNGGQDTAGFIWEFVAHAETTGLSYVWKLRNRGGGVIAMQPLPTSWVRKVYDDRTGQLLKYVMRGSVGHAEREIALEDMFVMRYPSANDPTGCAGPLQAALHDLQVDEARADLLVEMLTNLHFPGAIFKQELGWTPDDKNEARKVLRDLIGPGKRGSPLFVSGPNSSVEMPQPPKEMDWAGTAMQAETRICATYGIPPILVHFRAGIENGTYSNYDNARKSFYVDTMRSLWEMMASAFERGLLIDEGEEELELKPNFDDIAEMQEDATARHARIRDDFHAGLLMWDEAIEAVDGKPLPGNMGKVYLVPMNLTPVTLTNEAGGSLTTLPEPPPEEEHLEDADVKEDEDEPKPVIVVAER